MIDPIILTNLLIDLSFYYAIAGFILPSASVVWPAAIMFCSGTLGAILGANMRRIRLLTLLPLLVCVLFIHSVSDAVLILPPAVYVSYMIVTGRFEPDRYAFASFFKTSAIVLLFAMLIFLFFDKDGNIARDVLPYGACYLVNGVLLLRLLRQDPVTRMEPRYLLLNLLFPLLSILAALLLSSPQFLATSGAALGFLYKKLVYPLIMGLAYAVYGIIWVFQKLFSLLFRKRIEASGVQAAFDPGLTESEPLLTAENGSELPGQILISLGILAFLFVMLLLGKRLLGQRQTGHASTGTGAHETVALESGGLDLRRLFQPKNNRDALRQIYEKFLQRAKSLGIVIINSDTSADIASRCAQIYTPDVLDELRALYILARYSNHPITKEQLRRARALYADIKKVRQEA